MNTMGQARSDNRPGGGICRLMRMSPMVTSLTLPCIKRDLLRELDCYHEVAIDFSDVVAVDTASILAILAIRHDAKRKNKSLLFMSHNENFIQLLELMNKSPLEKP